MQQLAQGRTYKCFETEEIEGVQHQRMKERLEKKYARRQE
jgi:glutamyl/glutaminyl-tRNA synthetase